MKFYALYAQVHKMNEHQRGHSCLPISLNKFPLQNYQMDLSDI